MYIRVCTLRQNNRRLERSYVLRGLRDGNHFPFYDKQDPDFSVSLGVLLIEQQWKEKKKDNKNQQKHKFVVRQWRVPDLKSFRGND